MAENSAGKTSKTFRIEVLSDWHFPILIIIPNFHSNFSGPPRVLGPSHESLEALEGQELTLRCPYESDSGAIVKWTKHGAGNLPEKLIVNFSSVLNFSQNYYGLLRLFRF